MSLEDDFKTFWATFPRRVGKLAALKAYKKARQLASAEEILQGIAQYKQSKPDYADYCFPTTFLNQGRWLDEPEAPKSNRWHWEDCPHVPHCMNGWTCLSKSKAS